MRESCFDFRSRLSFALEGQPTGQDGGTDRQSQAREMQSLGWHEHLLHCTECRQLLESEQILDELLGSLPQPVLSSGQRDRLVQRLAENLRLESLLDEADPFQGAPRGLSDRILAGLRESTCTSEAGLQLDRNVDRHLAQLDDVRSPAGLADRVMRHCQEQGAPSAIELAPNGPREVRTNRKPIHFLRHWLSTCLVAASLAAFLWYLPGTTKTDPDGSSPVATDSRPDQEAPDDAEVLALLDTLEVMDLVDELDAEEWELVDQYDSYALFLMDESTVTDGEAR